MKKFILKKLDGKNGKLFQYAAVENIDGHLKVLCIRHSNKEYLACYVREITEKWDDNAGKTVKLKEPKYDAPFFFSRLDLIGKGDSRYATPYGLAILENLDIGKVTM